MREIVVEGDRLVVRFTGSDKIWAVTKGIDAPLGSVVSAMVIDRSEVPVWGWRLPGAYLPKVIRAGSYRHSGGRWELAGIRRGTRVVHVILEDHKYTDVYVEVDEPDATVAAINEARG